MDAYVFSFQLICTITPSSSNSEETHSTLKFAHRAKHIEIQAAQNKAFSQLKHNRRDDTAILKEDEEEEVIEALLSRIQRLTKLILVSNKSSHASRFSHRPLRRGHSFGEEELAYLPHRRRDLSLDDENVELYVSLDGTAETNKYVPKEEKKIKKPGLLNWLKPRVFYHVLLIVFLTSFIKFN
ncbi:putative kinesin motor domain, P-loop containing nucleoside triphosphate hydrolase [Helianthus annuus]|nr:putative kinesin motor domain, P-loop containing nucleoside triphosphate hydrolase [Helianthus annuus]